MHRSCVEAQVGGDPSYSCYHYSVSEALVFLYRKFTVSSHQYQAKIEAWHLHRLDIYYVGLAETPYPSWRTFGTQNSLAVACYGRCVALYWCVYRLTAAMLLTYPAGSRSKDGYLESLDERYLRSSPSNSNEKIVDWRIMTYSTNVSCPLDLWWFKLMYYWVTTYASQPLFALPYATTLHTFMHGGASTNLSIVLHHGSAF